MNSFKEKKQQSQLLVHEIKMDHEESKQNEKNCKISHKGCPWSASITRIGLACLPKISEKAFTFVNP